MRLVPVDGPDLISWVQSRRAGRPEAFEPTIPETQQFRDGSSVSKWVAAPTGTVQLSQKSQHTIRAKLSIPTTNEW
jgi:hypothetical protein